MKKSLTNYLTKKISPMVINYNNSSCIYNKTLLDSRPTSTDPTDDDAQQAAPPCNPSTSTAVVKTSTKRKNPYALGLDQLPTAFQRFLAEVKSFFTQKVNLQRQRAAISASTYAKSLRENSDAHR